MDIFRITIKERSGGAWPVAARHEPVGRTGKVDYDDQLKLPAGYEARLLAVSLEPQAYGTILGKALFNDELLEKFYTARGAGAGEIRVILSIEDASLQRLHWQRLCYYQNSQWQFLAHDQRTPFSLTWPVRVPWKYEYISREELKALVVVSNPGNLSGYGLDEFDAGATVSSLKQALGDIKTDVLALDVDGVDGRPTMNEITNRLAAEQYTLLHLVAHGRLRDGETDLFLANEAGEVKAIRGADFIGRLGKLKKLPHVIFLSTC